MSNERRFGRPRKLQTTVWFVNQFPIWHQKISMLTSDMRVSYTFDLAEITNPTAVK